MYPERGIVRTDRRSDGISKIPDDPKSLTCQSASTNDAPRDLILGPVTWNPAQHGPICVYVYRYVYSPARCHDLHEQQTP